MMCKLFKILTGAALVAKGFSQNCSPYPARPQQCSAGNRYCPADCTKTSRLSTICSSFVPTPAPVTVTASVTITASASVSTATKTITQNATCATQVPYLNIFSFKNQNCSTSITTPEPVCSGGLLGIGEECTCLSTNYTVSPNSIKINTPGIATLDDGYRYTQSTCVLLAVPDSNSVFFTVDGTDGTDATTSDCRVTFFTQVDCTGTQDGFNINKSGTCLSNDPTRYPPYNSAQFECSSVLGLV